MENVTDNFSSVNSLVYHASRISENWSLTNPFFLMLRSLLSNKLVEIETESLRKTQEYHFIAKMIYNELNNDQRETRRNITDIISVLDDYSREKQQNQAEFAIKCLFYALILKFLGKELHYSNLRPADVTKFLSRFQTENGNLRNMHRILCLVYCISLPSENETNINNDLDLSLSLLYSRLVLLDESKRTENRLLDYYIKQNKLDNMDISSISSERSMGTLLEVAVILKATSGNGLYLPEIEREQYLASFTKTVFRRKYLALLRENSSIKLLGLSIPDWTVIFLVCAIEAIVFSIPTLVESISIGPFSISTRALLELPLWIVLIANGCVIALFVFAQQKRLSRKISEEKWK